MPRRSSARVAEEAPMRKPRAARNRARRGRPPGSGHKTQTTVRISNEVLAFFRASGRGWQTRLDQALKRYVAAQRR